MQSLGEWMMSIPLARAAETVAFMRSTISPTRRVADAHQCLSQTSQMTTAVFFASHLIVSSITS